MLYWKMVSWPEIAFLEIYPKEWSWVGYKDVQMMSTRSQCAKCSAIWMMSQLAITLCWSWWPWSSFHAGKLRLREGTGSKSYIDEMSRSTQNLMILCWIPLPPTPKESVFWVPSSCVCLYAFQVVLGDHDFEVILPPKPVWAHFTYNSLREAGPLFYAWSPTLRLKGQHNNVLKAGPWELSLTGFRVCQGGRD